MAKLQQCPCPTAVRTVDLSQPLNALSDVLDYTSVRLFVSLADRLLGSVDIANHGQPVSVSRIREAIADGLPGELIEGIESLSSNGQFQAGLASPVAELIMMNADAPAVLSADVSVSVVVATRDRPNDLRNCLQCLSVQVSPRRVEIVVVDNNPDSGLTPQVVAEFPGVVLVNEPRQGLAYARNMGFIAASGDIAITTDDDVTMPPEWLERLVVPFACSDVAAVTGNTLPLELETVSQYLFEDYGGLGRGFKPLEADAHWFRSFRRHPAPTWTLGATANAAFRTTVFCHPEIGLMDEALGPGMPSGVGEDTYLFYKIIQAGYGLVYVPDAYVWHKHRRDMPTLRHQIYNYSKGHISYHLTTLLRDHDLRALTRLLISLPRSQLGRIKQRLRGRSVYPVSLIMLEILGSMVGPWALWKSRRRVRREGRSGPYVPVAQRSSADIANSVVEHAR